VPATGCVPLPSTEACDDASQCTVGDHCSGVDGTCVADPVPCEDQEACTVDACDPATGCAHTSLPDGTACPAIDACHAHGICTTGACVDGAAITCADDDACTDDSCDPATGCRFVPPPGVAAVTCHGTQLASMVDALPDDVESFARKLRAQVGCVQKRIASAAKKPGSAASKRQAKKARRCAQRLAERVQRSRLSATERSRFGDETTETVTAIETFFGL
jgi:hypothetical protein